MKLNVGDKLRNRRAPGAVVVILEVRDTGYTWRYEDVPDKDFWSENSSDPFFDHFWERVP